MKKWNIIEKHKFLLIAKSVLGVEIFLAPIMTIFYLDYVGVTFQEFAFFEIIIFTLAGMLEVPTGVLSDLFGRKKTLIMSELIYLSAMLLLVIFPNKLSLYIASVLYPLGATLGSGNLRSISYEVFKREDKESDYQQLLSKASGLQLFSGAVASIIGAYLASKSLALPMIIDSFVLGISILMTVAFLENDLKTKLFNEIDIQGIKKGYATLFHGLSYLTNKPSVMFLFFISASFLALIRGVFIIYQPLLLDAGYTIQSLGPIFAIFGGISAVFSFFSDKIASKLGTISGYTLLMSAIAIFSALIISSSLPISWIVLIAIVCHQSIRGLHPPFFSFHICSHIPKRFASRTTLLSVSNLMNSLFCGITIFVIGYAQGFTDYKTVFSIVTLFLTILVFISLLFYRRLEKVSTALVVE